MNFFTGKNSNDNKSSSEAHNSALSPQICFDPEMTCLHGTYQDEICLHRAKRIWGKVLENYFLLEPLNDFIIFNHSEVKERCFYLLCNFYTACGRYAFWRLTNNQAPEAQYIIETAHIPAGHSQADCILSAPDLKQKSFGVDTRTPFATAKIIEKIIQRIKS